MNELSTDSLDGHSMPAVGEKRKRRWWQFSLRTLLIGVAVCAALACWLSYPLERARRQRLAVEKLRNLGAAVTYDYQIVDAASFKSGRPLPPEPPGPEWLRRLLGVDFFSNVTAVDTTTCEPSHPFLLREDLEPLLHELPRLKYLSMRSRLCDDSWLHMLASFEDIETIDVGGNLTDEGLGHLAQLHQLASLKFRSALPVTHVGIARLAPLTTLRTLDLSDTPIDGSCLESLRKMENLDSVKLLVPNHGVATIDFHHAPRQSNR